MTNKSKLANIIRCLQLEAAAVCDACARTDTSACKGAVCPDIVRIVAEIDPLVSEYFRLELIEKHPAPDAAVDFRFWQRLLPMGAWPREVRKALTGGGSDSPAIFETGGGSDGPAEWGGGLQEQAMMPAPPAELPNNVPPNQKVLSVAWLDSAEQRPAAIRTSNASRY